MISYNELLLPMVDSSDSYLIGYAEDERKRECYVMLLDPTHALVHRITSMHVLCRAVLECLTTIRMVIRTFYHTFLQKV
jgi:hypothetical protein